ncbi:MAG: hypothetical protein HZA90_16850 [Verrucomicrobia bacterium]|nr:hypothetical protein [Verrucomicrobiota bacterium]
MTWLRRARRRAANRKRLFVAALAGVAGTAAAAQTNDLPPLDIPRVPVLWESVFTVRAEAGFKDNVTLAYQDAPSSAFVSGGVEALVTRLSLDGPQTTFFLDGDHREYLQGPVGREESASAQAQWKTPVGRRWEISLAGQVQYFDRVMDLSFTESIRTAVRVRGASFGPRPGLRLNVPGNCWVTLEVPVTRREVDEPVADQWETGVRLKLGRDYGHKSEINVSYEPRYLAYDAANQLAADGTALPNTHRALTQHETRLTWRHHWDAARRWRTSIRLGGRVNDDNGSGYFDYTKLFAGLELRYRTKRWEITAEVTLSRYLYSVQTVSATDLRHRDSMVAGGRLRCERSLGKGFKLVAEYEHEQVRSNDPFETYAVNTVSSGVNWEF